MCQPTDLFLQDATWSSVQGSWTGVERVVEPLQPLCRGGDMEESGDRGRTNRWTSERQTDGRLQVTTDRQEDYLQQEKERQNQILTSALSISATIFMALLAPLLHTNSMGLVSASHTSEATIQSSRSPGRTHKHTLKAEAPQLAPLITSAFKPS